jgi:flagellar hook protein FlgE
MMRAMYSAISGLKAHQTMLDVTANNLANVNTVGYKSARTTFADALSQTARAGVASNPGTGGTNAAQVGLGVRLGSIDNLMGAGGMQSTGNALDVAVQGEGWLRVTNTAVNDADPTANPPAADAIQYTRAGNLSRNDKGFLTTQDGYYVTGFAATATGPDTTTPSYINIPSDASDVAIGSDGSVSFVPSTGYTPQTGQAVQNGRVVAGYLSLAKFPNDAGLERAAGNRWRTTGSSGAEVVGQPSSTGYGSTAGGNLEMSNVDLATEFTTMITAQRGFQANSRVISTSDQMLQDLTQLGR